MARVLLTNCCTLFMTARANAVAASPMNRADPHTGSGGIANGSLAMDIAIKLNTAVTTIWTSARLMASTLGENLLIKITCSTQATAQPSTSSSPRPKVNWNELLTEMSITPSSESTTPSILPGVGLWRSIGTARMGTSGTYRPVMKPALLDETYCKPVVCSA